MKSKPRDFSDLLLRQVSEQVRASTVYPNCLTSQADLHNSVQGHRTHISEAAAKILEAKEGVKDTAFSVDEANSGACSLLGQLHGLSTLLQDEARSEPHSLLQLMQEGLERSLADAHAVVAYLGQANSDLSNVAALHKDILELEKDEVQYDQSGTTQAHVEKAMADAAASIENLHAEMLR
jgi:hypothetical protein